MPRDVSAARGSGNTQPMQGGTCAHGGGGYGTLSSSSMKSSISRELRSGSRQSHCTGCLRCLCLAIGRPSLSLVAAVSVSMVLLSHGHRNRNFSGKTADSGRRRLTSGDASSDIRRRSDDAAAVPCSPVLDVYLADAGGGGPAAVTDLEKLNCFPLLHYLPFSAALRRL